MTASTTEQERALSSLRHLYQQMAGGMVKDSAQAKRIAEGLLSPAIAKLEQAARRAPAVPVQEGWTDQLEQVLCDLQVGPYPSIALAVKRIEGLLAAAPQPPEEAPVELPEPWATVHPDRVHYSEAAWGGQTPAETKLYTDQQVRELLAAHGIEVAP